MPESFTVMVMLSPDIASQFPADAERGAPHVTVAHFKAPDVMISQFEAIMVADALRRACSAAAPFALALTGGVHEFAAPDKPDRPICAVVQSEGLLALRRGLFDALPDAEWVHAARDSHGGYVPHATLAYLPHGNAYDGPRPKGQMSVEAVELRAGADVLARVSIDGEPAAPILMSRGESYTPPETVASAARRGLRLREKVKAGTAVGVARARDLSNRRPVSLETIGRMVSFFARHGAQRPSDIGTDASPTPWLVAWLLWGGDAGRDWSASVWRRHGSEDRAVHGEAYAGPRPKGQMSVESVERGWMPAPLDAPGPTPDDDGLTRGKPLRVIASGPLHCRRTGEALEPLSDDDIRAMAGFIAARSATDPVVIGWDHAWASDSPKPLDQLLPLGVVEGAAVESDGLRSYLVVHPAYTEHGVDVLRKGKGALWPSMEWFPSAAHDRDTGRPVSPLLPLGVAVTPRPRYAPGTVDAVTLNSEARALKGDAVDPVPVDQSVGAQIAAMMERQSSLESKLGGVMTSVDELRSRVDAMAATTAPENGDGEAVPDAGPDAEPESEAAGESYKAIQRSEAAIKAIGDRLRQVEEAAALDRYRSEFADALVSGKVMPTERETFIRARSEQAAGRPAFYDAMFGQRAAGQYRSETPAVSTASAGKVDPGKEGLDAAKALYRSEFGKDWDPKSPDFYDNFRRIEGRLLKGGV